MNVQTGATVMLQPMDTPHVAVMQIKGEPDIVIGIANPNLTQGEVRSLFKAHPGCTRIYCATRT